MLTTSVRGRAITVLLVVAAVLQVVAWTRSERFQNANASALAERLFGPIPPKGGFLEIFCHRSLPPVVEQLPDGARTLLVTRALGPAAFDLFFIPRPFRYLQALDPALIELAHESDPEQGRLLELYRERLELDDALLTPERLERDLAWAEYVVVLVDAPAWPAGAPTLEPVAEHEHATLLRVVR